MKYSILTLLLVMFILDSCKSFDESISDIPLADTANIQIYQKIGCPGFHMKAVMWGSSYHDAYALIYTSDNWNTEFYIHSDDDNWSITPYLGGPMGYDCAKGLNEALDFSKRFKTYSDVLIYEKNIYYKIIATKRNSENEKRANQEVKKATQPCTEKVNIF